MTLSSDADVDECIQLGVSGSGLGAQLVALRKVETEQQSASAGRAGLQKTTAINLLCGGFHSAPLSATPATTPFSARVAGLPFAAAWYLAAR